MSHRHCVLWVAIAVAGCQAADDPDVTTDRGEVGINLGRAPDGINCISFQLDNEDGTTASFQFVLTANNVRVIPNLTIGAYDLSAVAYAADIPSPINNADCDAVPATAPWSTQAPVPVVVQKNVRSNIDLTLLPAGRIGVTVHWFEAPEVIAQHQGNVGAMVASTNPFGTFLAWEVAAHGPTGKIVGFNDVPGALPFDIITGQTNPAEMAIDPDSNLVYFENFVTGTTDGNGQVISDGSIANSNGILVAGINPGDLGFAVANHTVYWVGMTPGAGPGGGVPFNIDCFPCTQPLATGQVGANGLTAHGDRVYWGTSDGELHGMTAGDAAPTTLFNIAPRRAYGASADDQFVYFIDVSPFESIDTSKIDQVPSGGGATVTLVDGIVGGAFPIVAFHSFVYFQTFDGIKRVSTAGGPVEDVVFGSIGGFALTTDVNGFDLLYWSDATHGGLIWRGRL